MLSFDFIFRTFSIISRAQSSSLYQYVYIVCMTCEFHSGILVLPWFRYSNKEHTNFIWFLAHAMYWLKLEFFIDYRIHWRTKVHVSFQDIDRVHVKATCFDLVYRISCVSSAYVLRSDMDRCSPVDAVLQVLNK